MEICGLALPGVHWLGGAGMVEEIRVQKIIGPTASTGQVHGIRRKDGDRERGQFQKEMEERKKREEKEVIETPGISAETEAGLDTDENSGGKPPSVDVEREENGKSRTQRRRIDVIV
jgi:hypothetical protein